MNVIKIKSNKKQEIIDITKNVKEIVKKNKIKEGLCCVYVKHSTAAIIINENFDPSICDDILNTLNNLVPENLNYKHNAIDNNAPSHIKSSILSPFVCVPIFNGELQLGRWQGIGLVELDGPRIREILVSVLNTN